MGGGSVKDEQLAETRDNWLVHSLTFYQVIFTYCTRFDPKSKGLTKSKTQLNRFIANKIPFNAPNKVCGNKLAIKMQMNLISIN